MAKAIGIFVVRCVGCWVGQRVENAMTQFSPVSGSKLSAQDVGASKPENCFSWCWCRQQNPITTERLLRM
jgi:hypothetical protein